MTARTPQAAVTAKRKVCPPDHSHASAGTCYHQHKCRCVPCETRQRADQQHRRRLIAYGWWVGLVDATPAREHLAALSAAGVGVRRVAQLSRVNGRHLRSIALGDTVKVQQATATRILDVPLTALALGAFVDGRGVRRRIQALYALGWSPLHIGEQLGVFSSNVSRLTWQERVTLRVHDHVATVYEQLWDAPVPGTPGMRSRMQALAASRGWVAPLAWDDIDTDPTPGMDEIAEHHATGHAVLDDVAFLLSLGESPHQVAAAVDRTFGALAKLAHRHDRRELANLFGSLSKRVIEQGRAA